MYEKEIEYIQSLLDESDYKSDEYKMLHNIKDALETLNLVESNLHKVYEDV